MRQMCAINNVGSGMYTNGRASTNIVRERPLTSAIVMSKKYEKHGFQKMTRTTDPIMHLTCITCMRAHGHISGPKSWGAATGIQIGIPNYQQVPRHMDFERPKHLH